MRTSLGHRATGMVVALLLEAVLLVLLFTLGMGGEHEEEPPPALTTFDASADAPPEMEPVPDPEQQATPPPSAMAAPQPPQPAPPVETPAPVPPPAIAIPVPQAPPPPPAQPAPPAPPRARATVAPDAPAYGPPNTGSSMSMDTPRVGTAPNGQPMYAARWYREPTEQELAGYLSTASPGWALITCRTVADYRVEDCVALGESEGSQMARAVLAAAWQFRVRPPRVGGREMVGTWVRIRIDHTLRTR